MIELKYCIWKNFAAYKHQLYYSKAHELFNFNHNSFCAILYNVGYRLLAQRLVNAQKQKLQI